MLDGRFKKVNSKLISHNQTTFLENRNMLDGVLLVNELIDYARRLKKYMFLFKVEMEKAFNSVSWEDIYFIFSSVCILALNGLAGSALALATTQCRS